MFNNKSPLNVCKSTYCVYSYNFYFELTKQCYKLKCSHLTGYSFACQNDYFTATSQECRIFSSFLKQNMKSNKNNNPIYGFKYMKKKTSKYEFIF